MCSRPPGSRYWNCWRRKRRSRWRTPVCTNDLREREARIRRLVDSNIIGIFIGDSRGRILEANEAFLEMLGYNREDPCLGSDTVDQADARRVGPLADQDALAR